MSDGPSTPESVALPPPAEDSASSAQPEQVTNALITPAAETNDSALPGETPTEASSSQPPVTAESASTDVTAEGDNSAAMESQETKQTTQKNEVNLVATNILKQAQREARVKYDEHNQDESALTPSENSLVQIEFLREVLYGEGDWGEQKVPFTEGNPVKLIHNGQEITLASVQRLKKDGGILHVMELTESGEHHIPGITAEQILDAQFQAQGEKITSGLSENAKKVVDLELKIRSEGESALEGIDAGEFGKLMTETGREQGMILTESVATFFGQNKDLLTPEGKKVLLSLEGKHVLDSETAQALFAGFGVNEDAVAGQIVGLTNRMQSIEGALRVDPNNKALKNQLDSLREQKKLMNGVLEGLQKGSATDFLTDITEGNLDRETGKKLNEALMSGDREKLVDGLYPELVHKPTDDELEAARKEQRRKDMLALVGTTGIGAGIALILVMSAIGKSTKNFK